MKGSCHSIHNVLEMWRNYERTYIMVMITLRGNFNFNCTLMYGRGENTSSRTPDQTRLTIFIW